MAIPDLRGGRFYDNLSQDYCAQSLTAGVIMQLSQVSCWNQ